MPAETESIPFKGSLLGPGQRKNRPGPLVQVKGTLSWNERNAAAVEIRVIDGGEIEFPKKKKEKYFSSRVELDHRSG